MTIKILAFGIAKDIFQNAFVEVSTDEELSIADLKTILDEKYPKLKSLKSYLIAVNNEYATGEQVVKGNDEIAIIPPVSGG